MRLAKLLLLFTTVVFLIAGSNVHAQDLDSKQEQNVKGDAFEVETIVLLNPVAEFEQRAPSSKIMGGFIKAIESNATLIANKTFANDMTPQNGLIAVAIRPDGSNKFWIDVGDEYRPTMTSDLQAAMKDIGAPKVIGGPVAFLIRFKIRGGIKNPQVKIGPGAMPAKWKQAAKEIKKPNHEYGACSASVLRFAVWTPGKVDKFRFL